MEVAEKLYDPERRRKEEEALKIEYHSNIAREEGDIPIKDVMKATGLSRKQIKSLI